MLAVAVAMSLPAAAVMAATFGPVHYDPNRDQLIVTMSYDGTNSSHHFSIKWGTCRKGEQLDRPAHQTISVNILDDDHNDSAKGPYTETIRLPLANVSCRPATVTLWTPPNFSISVEIPAQP
jgi:hypothetical protein